MARYMALAIATKYWKPRTDYLREIVESIESKIDNGDYLVVSEKALSIAKNNIIDEALTEPSLTAKLIAKVWMTFVWGIFLGVVCRFGRRLRHRLRKYPKDEGSRHKQVSLIHAGFLQTLMFGSEGGIDGSNLPYSFVCLPLAGACGEAETIHREIFRQKCKSITVVVADTDKTYSFRNFHFTPRPKPMRGIQSGGGIVTYVAGRFFKLKRRPTPLAVAGRELSAEEALTVANVADRARGPGSGATVWDMASRFKVDATGVTWNMLEKVKHKPIVIVRRADKMKADSGICP